MSAHAIAKISGYDIPLIGIPPDATLEECDCCHDRFPLQDLELNERGKPLCRKCRKAK